MNSIIIWFHCFPKDVGVITEQSLFEQTRLSVFKSSCDTPETKAIFSGQFAEFIDFIAANGPFHDVEVVLPASEVLYAHVAVPSKSRNRIIAALPFLLDDFLVHDISQQHFALGDIDSEQTHVAIVRHEIMRHLFEQFKKMSLPVSVMTSEIFKLPWQTHQWSIGFLSDSVLIRTGKQQGSSHDLHHVDFILRLLLNDLMIDEEQDPVTNFPESFIIYAPQKSESVEKIIAIAQEFSIDVECVEEDFIERSLSEKNTIKKTTPTSNGINLMQGPYLPAHLTPVNIPFKKTLISALILCFISQFAWMGYQWKSYEQSLETFQTELEQLYFKTFPESKRLIDVRSQTQSKLMQVQKQSTSKHSFLSLLGRVGVEIQRHKGIRIQSMRYNDGILQLDVLSKGFIFNQLKSNLEKTQELLVEEKSSSRIKGEVHSVISFRLNEH